MSRLLIGALAGAVTLVGTLHAHARPFTVDDLMAQESFGQVVADPSGQYVVIERHRPFESAASFEYDYYNLFLRSELLLAPLDAERGAPKVLAPSAADVGYIAGPWSPSGERLVVYRLQGRQWSLGVFTVADDGLEWFDLTPDLALTGRSLQWRSDHELVLLTLPQARLPWHLRLPWQATERTAELWRAAHQGRVATAVTYGSGGLAQLAPPTDERRLVHLDVRSGESTTLAEGDIEDIELSPSGRYAATIELTEPLTFDPGAPFLQGIPTHQRRVTLVDLESGSAWSPAPDQDIMPTLLSWSPSGDGLLTWLRPADATWNEGRLTVMHPETERIEAVDLHGLAPEWTETSLRVPSIRAGWLAGRPILRAHTDAGRADWVRLSPDQGVNMTGSLPGSSPNLAAISPDSIILHAGSSAWRVDAGGVERLTPEGLSVRPVPSSISLVTPRLALNVPPSRSWAPFLDDEGSLHFAGLSARPRSHAGEVAAVAGEEIIILSTDGQGVGAVQYGGRTLARVNEGFREIDFARRVSVEHRGPEGAPLTSWLYLPASGAAEPPPLVVLVYPGAIYSQPHPWLEPGGGNFLTSAQVLAGLGYAVLTPSLPRDHVGAEIMEGLGRQIEAAVSAAADAFPLNTERVVLWGHSFGAYGALAAAAQSDQFSGVIAMNGPSDLIREWGEFVPTRRPFPEEGLSIRSKAGWVETGQGGMGVPPWVDPERYIRNSPFFHVDEITAPVMLVAADMDYSTLSGAEAMFSALYRQGRDAQLVVYRGEGHILASPANHRDLYARIDRWLRRIVNHEADRGSTP